MKKLNVLWMSMLCACMGVSFISCEKDDSGFEDFTPPVFSTKGVYILNSGNWKSNNATLDCYDPETKSISSKVFAANNGRGLGDTANDMVIYGSKMYIAVNMSGTIEVTDLSGKSVKTLSPKDEAGEPQLPRMVTAAQGKVFVSLYDGHVACIDTTSLEIIKKIKVGVNPEGVCELDGKLYVANSGGYNPVPDSTLSVVDLQTLTVEKELIVTCNPKTVQKDAMGNLYVLSLGNYGDIPGTLQQVDVATGKRKVIETNSQLISSVNKDKVYIYSAKQENWVVTEYGFKVYDVQKGAMVSANFITDGTVVDNAYCLSVDPVGRRVYIDTSDYVNTGDMFVFSPEGKLLDKVAVSGLNPMGAYFLTIQK